MLAIIEQVFVDAAPGDYQAEPGHKGQGPMGPLAWQGVWSGCTASHPDSDLQSSSTRVSAAIDISAEYSVQQLN